MPHADPVKSKEYHTAKYQRNKVKILAQSKARYEANKLQRSAQAKARYAKNKQHIIAKSNAWKLANREKWTMNRKNWKSHNGDCAKCCTLNSRMRKSYNLTIETYCHRLLAQDFKCAVCLKELGLRHETAVDHCHKSTKVRGLVHKTCNSLLGFAKVDIQTLKNAIVYLEKHNTCTDSPNIVDSIVA